MAKPKPKRTVASRKRTEQAADPPPQLLTPDEAKSSLFRTFRQIDAIADPERRRQAALDRLEHISELALGRERTVKNGIVISDPDCNAAVKVEEVAHRLMAIEPSKPRLGAGLSLVPFESAPGETG